MGKVSQEILSRARQMIKPGAKLIDVTNDIEKLIEEKGCKSAFPTNISIGERAAHFTPLFNDTAVFTEKDVVKVDLGLRKTDSLTDAAFTVDLSKSFGKLVETTEKALETGISKVRAGVRVNEIGKEVEKIAKANGFEPIKNLGGHGIEKGELHAGVFIPNFDNGDVTELREGQVVAVEVFLTDGFGHVDESSFVQIFRKSLGIVPRTNQYREISDYVEHNYSTYPFALRWLINKFGSEFRVRAMLNELARQEGIESFPGLVERKKGIVAQAEKSLIVEKDSCTIVT